MNQTQAESVAEQQANITVTVSVNNRPVTLHQHSITGDQIKAAAISQGVAIQQDFLLYIVRGNGQLDPVGDGETVHVHPHEQFRAVAPDDVSQAQRDARC